MDPVLHRLVLARLADDPPAEAGAAPLIAAACAGPAELRTVLEGGPPPAALPPTPSPAAEAPGEVHLAGLSVEGFRGIGPRLAIELVPRAGLTIVVGRNGSGKSSVAEALELLLTGANRRWAPPRSDVWRSGWRNLHHTGTTRIEASLRVAGRPGPVTVARTWNADAGLDEGTLAIAGGADTTLDGLGWTRALTAYRPFLPHNELGAVWDSGPTALHDALAGILGLEDLTDVTNLLGRERLGREQQAKAVAQNAAELGARLGENDDPRAVACAALLTRRRPDPDAVAAAAGDAAAVTGAGAVPALRLLAAVEVPDAAEVDRALAALLAAEAAHRAAADSDSGRARATAALLAAALDHVDAHGGGGRCPVCSTEGAIGPQWAAGTRAEVARLRTAADAAETAARTLHAARAAVVGILPAPPVAVAGAVDGVDTAPARAAWDAWRRRPDEPGGLHDHAAATLPPLLTELTALRAAAAAEDRRREDRWAPLAAAVRTWVDAARVARATEPTTVALKAAEGWLKGAAGSLRDARFTPIASAVQEGWTLLRQDSSVALGGLRLEGTGPRRKLELDVTIDGSSDRALAVMSQGELNALALSLFLPRAMLPESPFRFVVIDDPVQAMDPRRVEGLARLLQRVAATHQVVVLTHDDRLREAVRHLDIEARIVEVQRREQSVVEVRAVTTPVRRHLDDAFALASTRDLPAAAGRLVPAFLRLALEAAAADMVVRARLARGETVAAVDELLAATPRLLPRLALAFFDDADRGSDVTERLSRVPGPWAAHAVRRLNRGAHDEDTGDQLLLCREVERLCAALIPT